MSGANALYQARLRVGHALPAPHRHGRLEGREHLIVPVVAIVAGVLNGHLVPAEEIGAFVEAWNGIPLPIGHPQEHGQPVSANTPQRIEQSVGRFWGAQMQGDRLTGELWIDIAKCRQLGGDALEVLRRLEAGQPLEVSTAFWAETEEAAGEWGGQPYHGILRHLRPDHLALLPHEIGACSWADGCGAPRTASREEGGRMDDIGFAAALRSFVLRCVQGGRGPLTHVLSEARRPRFRGTESTPWQAPTFEDYVAALHEGEDPPARVQDASPALKRAIAEHTLLGDPEADNFRDLSFFPVVNPRTGRLNENALRAVLGGRAAQADIPASARQSAQAMARRLLNEEFGAELEAEMDRHTTIGATLRPHVTDSDIREAVQAALAREAGAAMTILLVEAIEGNRVIYRDGERLKARTFEVTPEGGIRLLDDVMEVTRDTRFHPVETPTAMQHKEAHMLSAQAQQHITALVSTPGSGWTEADRPMLEGMCEQAIARLHAHMIAQQTARAQAERRTPASLDDWLAQLPAEPRELVTQALERQKRHRQEIVESIVQEEGSPWTMDDLQAMTLEQLLKVKRSLHRATADYRAQGLPAAAATPDAQPLAAPNTMARVLEIQRQRGLIR
jgi:hypothetical protein